MPMPFLLLDSSLTLILAIYAVDTSTRLLARRRTQVRWAMRSFPKLLHFRRADRRAGCRASHVALDVVLVVTLVCEQSRDFRVCLRVPRRMTNRTRVGVFCTLMFFERKDLYFTFNSKKSAVFYIFTVTISIPLSTLTII